jgi:hypothetical protein
LVPERANDTDQTIPVLFRAQDESLALVPEIGCKRDEVVVAGDIKKRLGSIRPGQRLV